QPPRSINPAISEKLDAVIMKSLAKDAAERYQNLEEMLADIQRIPGEIPLLHAGLITAAVKTGIRETEIMAAVQPPDAAIDPARDSDREVDFSFQTNEEETEVRERKRNRSLAVLLAILILLLAGLS